MTSNPPSDLMHLLTANKQFNDNLLLWRHLQEAISSAASTQATCFNSQSRFQRNLLHSSAIFPSIRDENLAVKAMYNCSGKPELQHVSDSGTDRIVSALKTILDVHCETIGRHLEQLPALQSLSAGDERAASPAEAQWEDNASHEPRQDDGARLAFLAEAVRRAPNGQDPLQTQAAKVRADALAMLGGEAAIGRAIMSEEQLVEALAAGLPAEVIAMLREAGYSYAILEQVIAPRRTLMRRKSTGQRLTRAESDAAWRLAHVLALAANVLDGRKAALAWLERAKSTLNGRTPIDLLETSVGTAYVEQLLRSLDWGDAA